MPSTDRNDYPGEFTAHNYPYANRNRIRERCFWCGNHAGPGAAEYRTDRIGNPIAVHRGECLSAFDTSRAPKPAGS